MKNRIAHLIGPKTDRLITTFGKAQLVARPNGAIELKGGMAGDKTAAKEWISLFMHEAVVRFSK
ncbi:hypothetical protein [Pedosphaera parvula]|uniref:Uncharacterized protein n=1 Tax=Pedosphaera parvula (strain Ellin514) TaxID=320771 RepID=B9X9L0_PEDPL|nr:hypothetical protein [Pedosphaera parvula]EEF63254.1 hypothetical protein Cflav_PD5889 [Pedosphaera parvula Ellin514]